MSSPAARRAAIAAALVLLAGLTWGAFALLGGSRHNAAPGVVQPGAFVEDVAPRGESCEPVSALAEPADRAVLTIGTYGRRDARIELVARSAQRRLASSGTVMARNGVATLPLSPALTPADGALSLCVRNLSAAPIALAGVGYPKPDGSGQAGRDLSIRLLGKSESDLSRTGLTLDRYASARAGDLPGWVLVLALCLFAVTALASLIALVRLVRDDAGEAQVEGRA